MPARARVPNALFTAVILLAVPGPAIAADAIDERITDPEARACADRANARQEHAASGALRYLCR